jgi:hypothetical protein
MERPAAAAEIMPASNIVAAMTSNECCSARRNVTEIKLSAYKNKENIDLNSSILHQSFGRHSFLRMFPAKSPLRRKVSLLLPLQKKKRSTETDVHS